MTAEKKILRKLQESKQAQKTPPLEEAMWGEYDRLGKMATKLGADGVVDDYISDLLVARLSSHKATTKKAAARVRQWWKEMSSMEKEEARRIVKSMRIPTPREMDIEEALAPDRSP